MSRSDWLQRTVPRVPEEFVTRLARAVEVGAGDDGAKRVARPGTLPDPEQLMDAALASLARALSPEGRERGGAFDLLAADAFATWAAEAGLAGEDPEAWLVTMTRRLAKGPEGR